MFKIPVYEAEIKAGIAKKVSATASIAYCTPAQHLEGSTDFQKTVANWLSTQKLGDQLSHYDKALASLTDGDLYPVKSILASTNWNKNDDVFDNNEVWVARHTPAHKPDNINHEEKLIVGHMIDSWSVDEDGKVIADDIALDNLPTFFHLLNGSVIYTTWTDKEWKKTVADLVESIEKGEKFVSMECLFRGFDYAVLGPDNEMSVIARAKETAFLTKHLRAYGGEGTHEGYKIGRLMRRITFSGKGYVDKPANPESIIFSGENELKFSAASQINPFVRTNGVLISCKTDTKVNLENTDTNQLENSKAVTNQETVEMSDANTKVLEDTIADLKAQLKGLNDEHKSLAEKSTKASIEKFEKTIADLTDSNKGLKERVELVEGELKDTKSANVELAKSVKDKTEAHTTLEAELTKIKAQSTKINRIAELVNGGVEKEVAEATVTKFEKVDAETFKSIAELAIAAAKKAEAAPTETDEEKKAKKDAADKKAKADKAAAAAKALAEANLDGEPVLNANAGTEDEIPEVQKSLASYFDHILGNETVEAK